MADGDEDEAFRCQCAVVYTLKAVGRSTEDSHNNFYKRENKIEAQSN
jgi:hypothetical protein